jgi:copper(I)-binding protein
MMAAAERKEMRVNRTPTKPCSFLILAVLALAACQQNKAPEAPASEAASSEVPSSAAASPEAKPGITASEGVLRLPAVKGNPGAAYFSVSNGGPAAATLSAVHVDGAGRTEMHESMGGSMAPLKEVSLAAGETVKFAPGGKHVMLFDLDPKLAAGGTTEMTLVFAGGDKASIPLKIEPAGGAMDDMPGMGHGDHP